MVGRVGLSVRGCSSRGGVVGRGRSVSRGVVGRVVACSVCGVVVPGVVERGAVLGPSVVDGVCVGMEPAVGGGMAPAGVAEGAVDGGAVCCGVAVSAGAGGVAVAAPPMRVMSSLSGVFGVCDDGVGVWPWPGLACAVGALPGMAPLGIAPRPVPWFWLSSLLPSEEAPGVGLSAAAGMVVTESRSTCCAPGSGLELSGAGAGAGVGVGAGSGVGSLPRWSGIDCSGIDAPWPGADGSLPGPGLGGFSGEPSGRAESGVDVSGVEVSGVDVSGTGVGPPSMFDPVVPGEVDVSGEELAVDGSADGASGVDALGVEESGVVEPGVDVSGVDVSGVGESVPVGVLMLSRYACVPTSKGLGASEPWLGAGPDDDGDDGDEGSEESGRPPAGELEGSDGESDDGVWLPMSGAVRPDSLPLGAGELLGEGPSPDGEPGELGELLGELGALGELGPLDGELSLEGEPGELGEPEELGELGELSLPAPDALASASFPPPVSPPRAPCPARDPAPSRRDSPKVEPEFFRASLPSS